MNLRQHVLRTMPASVGAMFAAMALVAFHASRAHAEDPSPASISGQFAHEIDRIASADSPPADVGPALKLAEGVQVTDGPICAQMSRAVLERMKVCADPKRRLLLVDVLFALPWRSGAGFAADRTTEEALRAVETDAAALMKADVVPEVRLKLVQKLGFGGGSSVWTALRDMAHKDADPEVRYFALESAVWLDPKRLSEEERGAVGDLCVEAAGAEDITMRLAGAPSLAFGASQGWLTSERATEIVASRLKIEKAPEVLQQLGMALAQLAGHDFTAESLRQRLMDDPATDPIVREGIMFLLGKKNDAKGKEALLKALQSGKTEEVLMAAQALSRIEEEWAWEMLRDAVLGTIPIAATASGVDMKKLVLMIWVDGTAEFYKTKLRPAMERLKDPKLEASEKDVAEKAMRLATIHKHQTCEGLYRDAKQDPRVRALAYLGYCNCRSPAGHGGENFLQDIRENLADSKAPCVLRKMLVLMNSGAGICGVQSWAGEFMSRVRNILDSESDDWELRSFVVEFLCAQWPYGNEAYRTRLRDFLQSPSLANERLRNLAEHRLAEAKSGSPVMESMYREFFTQSIVAISGCARDALASYSRGEPHALAIVVSDLLMVDLLTPEELALIRGIVSTRR